MTSKHIFVLFIGIVLLASSVTHGFKLRDLPPSRSQTADSTVQKSKCDTCNRGTSPTKQSPLVFKTKFSITDGKVNEKPSSIHFSKEESLPVKSTIPAKQPISIKLDDNESDDDTDEETSVDTEQSDEETENDSEKEIVKKIDKGNKNKEKKSDKIDNNKNDEDSENDTDEDEIEIKGHSKKGDSDDDDDDDSDESDDDSDNKKETINKIDIEKLKINIKKQLEINMSSSKKTDEKETKDSENLTSKSEIKPSEKHKVDIVSTKPVPVQPKVAPSKLVPVQPKVAPPTPTKTPPKEQEKPLPKINVSSATSSKDLEKTQSKTNVSSPAKVLDEKKKDSTIKPNESIKVENKAKIVKEELKNIKKNVTSPILKPMVPTEKKVDKEKIPPTKPIKKPEEPLKTDNKSEKDSHKKDSNVKHKSSAEKIIEKSEFSSDDESEAVSKFDALKINKILKSTESKISETVHRKIIIDNSFSDFYALFPTFSPNFSRIHNPECRRHGQILLRQLKGGKLWPLQMLDSTAKIPSGVLRGNTHQFGQFDECLSIGARVRLKTGSVIKVSGRYCLAHLDLRPTSPNTRLPVHLLHSRDFIKSSHNDYILKPGHFIPRFTTINWGVCIPASCDASDAEFIVRDALRHFNYTSGVKIAVNVDPIDCHVKHSRWWKKWIDIPTIITVIFYLIVVSIVVYTTIKHMLLLKPKSNAESSNNTNNDESDINNEIENNENETERKNENNEPSTLVKTFSLIENIQHLLKNKQADGDIECIHGIKALCTLTLYIAHKLIPLGMLPFLNRISLTEISNSPFSAPLRASLLYTDTFLIISGILTAYHMSRDIDKSGSIPFFQRFVARYLRLTPVLLAVLLWYAYISDKIGDGPLWGTVVTKNAELCQSNMWQNLLYIQNFFPFEDICATHTHQLALDIQLWWLAPITVWALRFKPFFALSFLGVLHSLAVWFRYSATISNNLSLIIFHGITVNQLYRTANFCYSIALHRATPYLAGIGLGVLLQQTKNNTKLSKYIFIPGWLSCIYFGGWALYMPAHMGMRDYQYDVNEAAQYAALASVAWALCLSWIIFICFTGNGGVINSFLCAHPLLILSKISYSMYLVQFLIFFYNVGTERTSTEFNLSSAIDGYEMLSIILVSVVLTLLFDLPMQNFKKIIIMYESKVKTEDNEEQTDNTNINIDNENIEVNINNENENTETIETDDQTEEIIMEEEYIQEEEEENILDEEMSYVYRDNTESLIYDGIQNEIIYEEEEEEEDDEEEIRDHSENIKKSDRWTTEVGGIEEEITNEHDDDLDGWEWTGDENRHEKK